MRTPHHDAGVVAQQVDRLAGLTYGLLADSARVTPLQREVLPHEHAQHIGRLVQLWAGDVPVHAHQVETRITCQFDIASHELGCGLRQRSACGREVGALGEQTLAVDGEHPVLHGYFPQSGAQCAAIALLAVDQDFHHHIGERLLAKAPWPPQVGVAHVERPVDLVHAVGDGAGLLPKHRAVDRGAQQDRA